jgi:hypothetical protein
MTLIPVEAFLKMIARPIIQYLRKYAPALIHTYLPSANNLPEGNRYLLAEIQDDKTQL